MCVVRLNIVLLDPTVGDKNHAERYVHGDGGVLIIAECDLYLQSNILIAP